MQQLLAVAEHVAATGAAVDPVVVVAVAAVVETIAVVVATAVVAAANLNSPYL